MYQNTTEIVAYVETANTSHSSGDRNCGHTSIECRAGEQPVSQPRTPYVNQREHAGADHGKNRHGLRETADRVTPALLEQQQNRRNQRAGMADADPPHKIDDGKAPGHRLRDCPDAHALAETATSPPPAASSRRRRRCRNSANQPSGVCGVSTMRVILSVTDLKVSPGARTRNSPVAGSSTRIVGFHFSGRHRRLQPFAGSVFHRRFFEFGVRFRTAATYLVRGRVF